MQLPGCYRSLNIGRVLFFSFFLPPFQISCVTKEDFKKEGENQKYRVPDRMMRLTGTREHGTTLIEKSLTTTDVVGWYSPAWGPWHSTTQLLVT